MGQSISNILTDTKIKFDFSENTYYLLSVHILSGNVFDVYINDILHISFNHSTNNNVLSSGYSGFIGIKSSIFTKITTKSLYISGSEIQINSTSIKTHCPSSDYPSTTDTNSNELEIEEITTDDIILYNNDNNETTISSE